MLSSEAIWLHFSKKLLLLVNIYVRLRIKILCVPIDNRRFFFVHQIYKVVHVYGSVMKLSHCGSQTENGK